MKKIKILRLFLTFICIIAISLVGNNVYGYQLKYKAVASKTENNDQVYFLSMGTAFGAPPPTLKFESSDEYVNLNKTGVYQTYEFMIQSSPTTIYNSKNGVDVTYAYTGENVITIENYTQFSEFYSKGESKVSGKRDNVNTISTRRGVENVGRNVVSVYDGRKNGNMSVTNNFLIQGKSANFNSYEESVIDGPGVQTVMVTKWKVAYKALEDMINSNKSAYVKVDNDSSKKYVWFSLPCILHNANTLNNDYIYVALNTAYDFVMRF